MKTKLPLLLLLTVGCSCSSSMKLDPQSAIEGNDLTALISGCGRQVGVGYLVCRMPEGQLTKNEYLRVHAPPQVKCENKDACLYFTIFYPDGRPTFEGRVEKGKSSAQVSLAEIIDKPYFELSDRGFYGISVKLNYTGTDGIERRSYAEGIVFLRVVGKSYTSLLENEEDENFAWLWKENDQVIKLTTGFRAFISSPKPEPGLSESWLQYY